MEVMVRGNLLAVPSKLSPTQWLDEDHTLLEVIVRDYQLATPNNLSSSVVRTRPVSYTHLRAHETA